jgi:hypothetical protein
MLSDEPWPREITCLSSGCDVTLFEVLARGPANEKEVPMSIIPTSVIHGGALAFALRFG